MMKLTILILICPIVISSQAFAATLPAPSDPWYFLYDLFVNSIMLGPIGYIAFMCVVIIAISRIMHWDMKTFTKEEGNPIAVRIGGFAALAGGVFLWKSVVGNLLISVGAII